MKIILSIIALLFLIGCSEDTKKETHKEAHKKVLKTEPKVVEVQEVQEVIEVDAPQQEVIPKELSKVFNGKKL